MKHASQSNAPSNAGGVFHFKPWLGRGLGFSKALHRAIAALSLLVALAGHASSASAVTVGSAGNCDFLSLQAAIDSIPRGGSVNIRLTNPVGGYVASPILLVDRSAHITGGYTSCTDLTSDANRNQYVPV